METEKHAYEQSYEKEDHIHDHAPIDMTNRKDSIAYQEGAELYGSAEEAESACEPRTFEYDVAER